MEELHSKETAFKILTFALRNNMTVEMTDAICGQMAGQATPEMTKQKVMAWAKVNMPDKLEIVSKFIDLINEGFYRDTKHHENN